MHGAPAGRLRIGVAIDPDYASAYLVDISCLDVWSDADQDGLADLEENELGTSVASADSDGDGVDDWTDLLPLDPKVDRGESVRRQAPAVHALCRAVRVTTIGQAINYQACSPFPAPG